MRPVDWLFFAILAGGYFAPSIIAIRRESDRTFMIVMLNLCFGWTLIVWGGCLMLAVYRPSTAAQHGGHGHSPRGLSDPSWAKLPRGKQRVEPTFD